MVFGTVFWYWTLHEQPYLQTRHRQLTFRFFFFLNLNSILVWTVIQIWGFVYQEFGDANWVDTTVVAADGTNTITLICQEKGLGDSMCPDTKTSRSYVGLGVGLTILASLLLAAFARLWYTQKDQQSRSATFDTEVKEPDLDLRNSSECRGLACLSLIIPFVDCHQSA